MNRKLGAAAIAVAWMCARGRASHAQDNLLEREAAAGRRSPAGCADARDAATVVACALAASPEVAEARALVDAAAGRRETAAVVLPSNPTLAGTISNRRRPDEPRSVPNWSVSLAQEIEIGGQRGARLEVADAERQAREARLRVATEEVAAGALTAYYQAIAAREALTFATELASTARALADYAEARAHEELVSGVEADVARAEATRIGVIRFEAERHLAETVAILALLLDVPGARVALPPALPASAPLAGDGAFFAAQALRVRGEVAAAEAEQRLLERRLALVRRERISSPTVSLFAERGEVRDHIFGVGLAVPLPVPAPIGRTRAGEISEAIAQLRAAQSSRELARRRVLTEVARATTAYWAKVGEAALFEPALMSRARADLTALRDALAARRLTLREGLSWQRSLIELLSADIDARLAKLTAEVELRRVSGLPLGAGGGGAR